MRDMIQVTSRVIRSGMDSPTKAKTGGISAFPGVGLGSKCMRLPMKVAPLRRANIRAMKISKDQTARRPSGPTKMTRTVNSLAGASGVWIGGSAWGFSGSRVERFVGSVIGWALRQSQVRQSVREDTCPDSARLYTQTALKEFSITEDSVDLLGLGEALVDAGQGLEAVFDYRGLDVVFGDQDGLEEDAGDFGGVGGAFGVGLFAF